MAGSGEEQRQRLDRRDVWSLVLIVYSALLVRGYVPFRNVFGGGQVSFQGNDAWYHMRLIDHLVHDFPHRLRFDPYARFPDGQEVGVAPLLDFAVAQSAWLLGLGSPSERLVEVVAAWFPAVLGALTPVPVYLLGRRLFDRRAGLLAAGLLAVQPGQFLLRSLLGFVDHHVAESLLSVATIWLLVVALDRAAEAPPRQSSAPRKAPASGAARAPRAAADGWRTERSAALAGLALGAYLLSWGGGSLFVAVLIAWAAVQYTLDVLRSRSSAYLGRVLLPAAGAATAALLPWLGALPRAELHLAALAGLAAAPVLLAGLARVLRRVAAPRWLFPVSLAAGLVLGWLLLVAGWPSLADGIRGNLARFLPSELAVTVNEARPLLRSAATPLDAVWTQYRSAFFLGVVGLVVFWHRIVRRGGRPGHLLLLLWSLATFAATLGQNRFGYYLDVNLCLLVGLLCRMILAPFPVSGLLGPGASKPGGRSLAASRRPILRAVAALGLALLAFLPTLRPVMAAARPPRGPSPEWFDALSWMRENTPEPFGDADAYLRRFEPPPPDEPFAYPPEAYGVMSWWDYGYWVTRIARRIPNANPTQAGAEIAARFYTATSESEAVRILEQAGSRYAVVNFDLGLWPDPASGGVYGLFESLAVWAGLPGSRFFELYWERQTGGELVPAYFFYPAFYQSTAVRLSLTGGEPIFTTAASWVIRFRERPDEQRGAGRPGHRIKEVISAHQFLTYREAQAFLAAQEEGDWRLVGRDPLVPCLPLQATRRLRQVYQSPEPEALPPGGLPSIRVFELEGA